MAISTYTELQSAVANWINRSDLGSVIVDCIALGEKRINRDLRVAQMELEVTGTISASLTLPTRYVGARHVALSISGREFYLPPATPQEKSEYAISGRPRTYGVVNNVMEFYPTPDGTYSYRLVYYQGVEIATTTTNWLIQSHPDVYLFSALQEVAVYLRDVEGVGIYEGRYRQAIADVYKDSDRRRYGAGSSVNTNRRAIA